MSLGLVILAQVPPRTRAYVVMVQKLVTTACGGVAMANNSQHKRHVTIKTTIATDNSMTTHPAPLARFVIMDNVSVRTIQ